MNLKPLLNREFKLPAGESYQLVPKGEYTLNYNKKKIIQVVDDEGLRAMFADLANRAQEPNWGGVLIDYDHFSLETDKPTAAAGWALESSAPELRNQAPDPGLWGGIRWTNSGKSAVEGGDYRFLSPVFDPESVVPLGGNRYRVTKLDRLAVTNDPNMKGMVPLSNRSEIDRPNNQPNTQMLTRILTLLGLANSSTEDQAIDAVRELKNRASQVDTLKDTHVIKADHTALQNRYDMLVGEQINGVLDKFENRFGKDQREAWKNRLKANFADTLEILDSLPEAKAADGKDGKKPLHNRATARTPNAGDPAGETKPDAVCATKLRNRAAELRKTNPRLTLSNSYAQAQTELEAAAK